MQILITVADFFELEGRDILPPKSCQRCGPKIREIRLTHPPEIFGDHVYSFQAEPLIIRVQECLAIEDVLSLMGIRTYSSTPVPALSSLRENWRDVLNAATLDGLESRVLRGGTPPSFHDEECFLQSLLGNCQIVVESLPKIDTLIKWGSQDIYQKAKVIPTDVESVLDGVLVQYLKGGESAPLVRYSVL